MVKTFFNSIQSFFKMEAQSSVYLGVSIILALLFANVEFLSEIYAAILHSKFSFELIGISIVDKSFHYFVNDGLMAIFFLLIGLEVKREFLEGELSNPANILLPGLSALGGLVVPCLIYYTMNKGLPTEAGWAISGATDIALAVGVIAVFGKRIPLSLKTFLLMLAIFDDVMVVGLIAVFFTDNISLPFLGGTAACIAVLSLMNYKNISNFSPFAIVGFILWYFTLQSGIHSTIAGIALAIFIPAKPRKIYDEHNDIELKRPSMLSELEHSLHEFVSYGVLPLFAFLNAGIAISVDDIVNLNSPEGLGIIFGLFFGKQIGIFFVAFLLIKMKISDMPKGANLIQLYGIAVLCGVGFTMGLFIGDLAFKDIEVAFKLPILVGSLLSAVFGVLFLQIGTRKAEKEEALLKKA